MGCSHSSCSILHDECIDVKTHTVRLYCIFYVWLYQLLFMDVSHHSEPVDKKTVRNNIDSGRASYSQDKNGRKPIQDDTIPEDRRFLFLDKTNWRK